MKYMTILLLVLFNTVCSSAQTAKPATGEVSEKSQPSAKSVLSWKTVIAPQDEPGERLTVTGTVYDADGRTPLAGATVYVYHTDTRGFYSGETTNSSNPRLKATLSTDARGRYEYETIKPGPYPAARVPAHIHYVVNAPGYGEKIFEIVFEGDAFISDAMREDAKRENGIFSIRPLTRESDGRLRCVQDIRLAKQ